MFRLTTPPREIRRPDSRLVAKFKRIGTNLTNILLVFFTGLLVGATALYAYFAYRQWQAIADQAGIAKRNTETFLALESPYVLLRFEAVHPQQTVPFDEITLEVYNFGRTPMFVTDVCMRFEVAKEEDLSPIPGYIREDRREDHRPPQIPHVVLPTESHTEPYPDLATAWPPRVQLAPFKEGPQCWAYGYVEYLDLFDRRRRKGFCVRRLSHTNAVDWVLKSVRPSYVYLKEDDGKDWRDVKSS